ncbi:MAG: hypothetical protein HYW86_04020 [Candidatus Roizmanbacteria bacterium]|nr:MAG: hypothetical protein HYW86_04020 [Candidatus Roizmanbacteria bacterium]
MENQKIVWFQDGVKLKAPKSQWEKIDSLNRQLINLAGHPSFDHQIIEPVECVRNLFSQINFHQHSVIIDLSGMFGEDLKKTFPRLPVVDNFRLSRVRVITSPRLDGVGHLITLNSKELAELKNSADLSHPLFIDDICWSGRTALDAVKIIGADLSNTTFGFLTLNRGNFGESVPCPVQIFEQSGAKVLNGIAVHTPQDDGFHLADFFENPSTSNPDVFGIIIRIQELRERAATSDETAKKTLEAEIKGLLLENREVLFPSSRSTQEMKELQAEGRLIANGGINKNSFFDINPPNWLMPSFSRRVNSQMLRNSKAEITDVIRELKSITESSRELKKEQISEPSNEFSIARRCETL